jgi:hypothetical protein
MHYIACSIMHKLDLVRGQDTNVSDTNGSNTNDTGGDDIAGAKVHRDTERGGG